MLLSVKLAICCPALSSPELVMKRARDFLVVNPPDSDLGSDALNNDVSFIGSFKQSFRNCY